MIYRRQIFSVDAFLFGCNSGKDLRNVFLCDNLLTHVGTCQLWSRAHMQDNEI